MNPIITVIIPVYNGEKFITRAAESVLNQPEGRKIELLLVNDGSKDNSGKVCDLLAQKYQNIRVLHKDNGGVSAARNLGIQNVQTKYVAFLDCDDWWEQNFFDDTIFRELRLDESADVYQFAYQEVDYYYRLKKVFPVADKRYCYGENGLGRYDWAHPCSFVYRTALLKNNAVQYPVSKVGEDGPFVEMALYCAGSLHRINRVMFSYWKNNNSCVHTTRRIDSLKEEYKALLQEKEFLATYGEKLDADVSLIWSIANSLPKLAATSNYQEFREFMNIYCLRILDARSDIHFRKKLWNRLAFFRKVPLLCWLKYQIITGVPLKIRGVLYGIPMFCQIADYLFSRYVRGYVPL